MLSRFSGAITSLPRNTFLIALAKDMHLLGSPWTHITLSGLGFTVRMYLRVVFLSLWPEKPSMV